MGKPKSASAVLAIAPVSRGVGYTFFESPRSPVDWGVRTARIGKNELSRRHVDSLMTFYQPDTLVLERFGEDTNRDRVANLNDQLASIAAGRGVEVVQLHRDEIKGVFGQMGSKTKFGIAKTIADWLPELAPHMPRYRVPWRSEDHSMAIFEAAALALCYYYIHS